VTGPGAVDQLGSPGPVDQLGSPGPVDQLGSPGPVDQRGSPGPVDQRQSGPGGLASLRPRDSGQIETRNAAGHRRMDRSRGPAGQ